MPCSRVILKWIHGQKQGLTNYMVQEFNVLKFVVSQAAKKILCYLLTKFTAAVTVLDWGHMAVVGGTLTASEEMREPAGNGIMRYFGIWVDELRKTPEEPDGTAGTGTTVLIKSSPLSSLQHKRVLTSDAMRSCIIEREAHLMFWRLLTPSLLAATLIAYWQFKRRKLIRRICESRVSA